MASKFIVVVALAGAVLGGCAKKPGATASTMLPPSTQAPDSTGGTNFGGDQSDNLQANLASTAGDRVFFALDSHSLSAEARQSLIAQTGWLRQHPAVNVTIEGHCDERGTREYNLALGNRRAQAVAEFLILQGISASRLTTISYGKERPEALGSDDESWAQNRRAVSIVVRGNGG